MDSKIVGRRLLAYFIDILIITFAASMLASISYLNPKLESYNKVYDEFLELTKNNIEEIDQKSLAELNYKLDRNNIYGATISIVLTVLYFVFFQKYNGGQTLGKKLTKIKLEDNTSLSAYFIRTLILHNVLINVLKVVSVLNFSETRYMKVSNILYLTELFIQVAIIVMIIMREDKRGLHDLIANTNVVSAKNEVIKCTTN